MEEFGLAPGDEPRVCDLIALGGEQGLAERRRRAIRQMAGSLADVYEPGYLDKLRDEWR